MNQSGAANLATVQRKLDSFAFLQRQTFGFGADLSVIQQRLNQLGANPPLSVDGVNGPLTQAAIRAFQSSHGLTPDGIVGPLTLTALGLSTPTPPQVSGPAKGDSVVRVKGIETLSKPDLQALSAAASWIGVPTDWLATAISFESNGTFSPAIQNATSKATGLIQFLPSTMCRLLGIPSTAENKAAATAMFQAMTFAQQLEYVKKYFENYRGKLTNMADLYLVIFYPAEVGKSPTDIVAYQGDPVYDQNAGFDRGNKGYITHDDIASTVVNKLNAALALGDRIPIPAAAIGIGAGMLAIAGGIASWWLFRKGVM